MSTHTPGKWETTSNMVRTCRAEDGSGGFLVAECPANVGARLEDAQLIAAAPELLEALQSLVCDHGGTRAVSPDDERAIKAIAAIRKATGSQS